MFSLWAPGVYSCQAGLVGTVPICRFLGGQAVRPERSVTQGLASDRLAATGGAAEEGDVARAAIRLATAP